jgi:hypothetical protein
VEKKKEREKRTYTSKTRQDKRYVRQAGVLRFEDRVPSKLGRPARSDDRAVRASLEENRVRPGTRAVRERA